MAELNKDEIIKTLTDVAVLKATQFADDEISKFEKSNPNELVDQEVKALVRQRCISELMFRMCNYKKNKEITTVSDLETDFTNWITMGEEVKIRNMCVGTIKGELKKRSRPGDENLTFTDRYLRKVKQQQKKHSSNVAAIISALNK